MTDATTARRQQRRRAKLDEAARAGGWHSWSEYERHIINGAIEMQNKAEAKALPNYIAIGSVRGSCGHNHKTAESAAKCAAKDHKACARLGGGAYSDRTVEREDGAELTAQEAEEVENILNPE